MTGPGDSRPDKDSFIDDLAEIELSVIDIAVSQDPEGRPSGSQKVLHRLEGFQRLVCGGGRNMCVLGVIRVHERMDMAVDHSG